MNKKNIVGILIIIGLMIFVFQLKSSILHLNDRISGVSSQINSLQSEIGNLRRGMNDELEKSKWIESVYYEIENVNSLYKAGLVDVTVIFNKIHQDSDVKFFYRTEERIFFALDDLLNDDKNLKRKENSKLVYGEWKELSLNRLSSVEYTGLFSGNYKYDYQCKIVLLSNGEYISESVEDIALYQDSIPEYNLDIMKNSILSSGKLNHQSNLEYNVDINSIEIESVYIETYNEDILIDEFELINEEYDLSNSLDFKFYSTCRDVVFTPSEKGIDFENIYIKATIIDTLGRTFIQYNNDYYMMR